MLKSALVPLTLRERPERVEALFEFLKGMRVQSVVLFHVQGERARHRVERSLMALADSAEVMGLKTSIGTRSGPVASTVIEAAMSQRVDMIALPFARKNWLQRALLGSVTKDLIRTSPLPVFVHKEWPKERSGERSEDGVFRILYATSLKPSDDKILPYVRRSELANGEVILLHVGRRAPDPEAEERRHNESIASLNGLAMRCGLTAENVRIESVIGRPKRRIVRYGRMEEADLIIIGKADTRVDGNGSTGNGTAGTQDARTAQLRQDSDATPEPVLGSTAGEVSYNAWSSVLVVPTQAVPEVTPQ